MSEARQEIRVLHVDDEADFADRTASFLERENERFSVDTETSARDALECVTGRAYDCIASDHEMPGMTGLEFLCEVREEHPDLPFILFTGKGSEEVASDAISAGVTDYLQKGGTEQCELPANRITNAVDRYVIERERRQWKWAVETANQGIAILDADGGFVQMNDAYAEAFDEPPEAVVGTDRREWYPEEAVERFDAVILSALEREGTWDGEAAAQRADGTVVDQQLSLSTLEDGGQVCVMELLAERDGG